MALLKTIISLPGKLRSDKNKPATTTATSSLRSADSLTLQPRMLVGVLYSVSRGMSGELFPLYVGRNTIGSDADSDICLREQSVEPSHAVMLVRRIEDQEGKLKMTVSICDDTPGSPVSVNGQRQEYDRIYCSDGDLIEIGPHYSLRLRLLTPEICGLQPDPEFVALSSVARDAPAREAVAGAPGKADDNENYRSSIGEDDERSFYTPSKAKEPDHLANRTIVE